ncbi:hypothetical protein CR513_00353, partial [Mucuna pruriens]
MDESKLMSTPIQAVNSNYIETQKLIQAWIGQHGRAPINMVMHSHRDYARMCQPTWVVLHEQDCTQQHAT